LSGNRKPASWQSGLFTLAAWTVLALVATVQASFANWPPTQRPSFALLLAWQLPQWYSWAALTPLILRADGHARRSGRGLPTLVVLHASVATVAILAHSIVVTLADSWILAAPGQQPFGTALLLHLRSRSQFELLTYSGIVGVGYAIAFFHRQQREALAAAEAQAELARAELRALKMQLQPHFLFNALQSLIVLNGRDPQSGSEMMHHLASLFRYVLGTSHVQEVALEEELGFVDRYLDIERLRFQERLDVRFDVPAETRKAMVPHFLLQPLVENAIRHGIAQQVGTGFVRIASRHEDAILRLIVEDNGVGPGADAGESRNSGLDITRRRLTQLHGGIAQLSIEARAEGGTTCMIELPWKVVSP